jgi:hypothetical protein
MVYLAGQNYMTFILVLLSAARAEYVELGLKNLARYFSSNRPLLIKFYRLGCGTCGKIAGPFSEASTMFHYFVFGGVNCIVEEEICRELNISTTPQIQFFQPPNRTGVRYPGPNTVDGFVAYVENQTGRRSRRSQASKLIEHSPKSMDKAFVPGKCGLALFYDKKFPDHKHLLPQIGHLTFVYLGDPNVSIGVVNCTHHPEYCKKQGAERNPETDEPLCFLRIYAQESWSPYTGPNEMRHWIRTLNEQCNVERRVDGLLSDEAGRIPEADEIAQEFIDAFNKPALIERMKAIQGADVYVKVIERFMEGGTERLKKDVESMKKNLDEQKGSPNVLDAMKRRYNIYMQFLAQEMQSDVQDYL